ncbi:MAG: adenylate/guanylate cyclase domain-containing protein [bacterium]
MKLEKFLGLQSELSPELEIEFEERTSKWINKTFRAGLLIISATTWMVCLLYQSYGLGGSIIQLAIACQILLAYGYMTTFFEGATRRVINKTTAVFPIAYVYGFMTYYVPSLPSDSLVFQSQGWIVWVIMLIYAIERLSPLLAAISGILTSLLYFYLRFKIPQFQEVPYIQVAAQLLAANLTGFFIVKDHTANARRQFKLERELEAERSSSDKLLKNVLPVSIVGELKSKSLTVAHNYESVTVLFADLVDFTKTAATMNSQALVKLLDELFSRFDALAEQHGVEKIKTIGDAYMAAAGCPEADSQHAVRMTQFALDLDGVVQRFNSDFATAFKLKVGLSSGAVIGGVIGTKRISFDLWGDVVNLASRIESVAVSGEVLVSESTAQLIQGIYELSPSRVIDLKGKGPTNVYSLLRDGKSRTHSLTAPRPISPKLVEPSIEDPTSGITT